MTTESEILQTAAEWAAVFKVTESAFNEWKRKAQRKTGKIFGTKEGVKTYFSSSEVRIIAEHRVTRPTYESEDPRACEQAAGLALSQRNNAIVSELQEVLQIAADQEADLIDTAAKYLAPSNRKARIMRGIAARIEAIEEQSLTIALESSFDDRLLPPASFI